MKKVYSILFLIIALMFSQILAAQTITGSTITISESVGGGNTVVGGEDVKIQCDYTQAGSTTNSLTVYGIGLSIIEQNRLTLRWYNTSGVHMSSEDQVITVSTFSPATSSDGAHTSYTSFTLPTVPTGANEFEILTTIYGVDNGTTYVTSGNVLSNKLWTSADDETDDPTMVSPSSDVFVTGLFKLEFSIPEDALANSIEISFIRTGGETDANSHVFTYGGSETSGTKTLYNVSPLLINGHGQLTLKSGVTSNSNTLNSGTTYTVECSYQDYRGNDAATDVNTGVTFDNETLAPTLVSPANNANIKNPFGVEFQLGEKPTTSTVKLSFIRDGGDTYTSPNTHVFTYAGTLPDPVTNSITITGINPANIGNHSKLTLVSGSNTLNDGTTYTIKIEYQDEAGNPVHSDKHEHIFYAEDYILISGNDYDLGGVFPPGSTNNPYFQMLLKKVGSSGSLPVTGITFDSTGDFVAGDIDNFKIWTSTSSEFNASASLVSTLSATSLSNSDQLVFSLGQNGWLNAIQAPTSGIFVYLTADISAGADESHLIGAEILNNSDIVSTAPVSGAPVNGGDHPLPVTLSSFSAIQDDEFVSLQWITASESNNSHWNVYRSPSENFGQATKLNADNIAAAGYSSEPVIYDFLDSEDLELGQKYWYWIECVAFNGMTDMMEPTSVLLDIEINDEQTPDVPTEFGLFQNSPNPFNPDTKISFALEESSDVSIEIYNSKGQKVIRLFDGYVNKNAEKSVWWNGKDANGSTVTSGVYLYILKSSNQTYSKRMLLIK